MGYTNFGCVRVLGGLGCVPRLMNRLGSGSIRPDLVLVAARLASEPQAVRRVERGREDGHDALAGLQHQIVLG